MKTAQPAVQSFFDPATNTISYVVADPATNQAAIIDSVLDYDPAAGRTSTTSADKIIAYVHQHNLKVQWVLETHAHADHLSAAPYLKDKLGGTLSIGEHIKTVQDVFGKIFNAGTKFQRDGSQFDKLFTDGEHFALGTIPVTVMHTPGHTPACLTYVVGDAAFVGDTLFMPDYGTARCDFPGGSAQQLYRSVQKLYKLPSNTRMFLCHDYLPEGRKEYKWETTVAEQRASNIHIRDGVTEEQFVAQRTARDKTLGMPKLILPSVQVNMRAGHMPPPEDNGTTYLKIPVNKL